MDQQLRDDGERIGMALNQTQQVTIVNSADSVNHNDSIIRVRLNEDDCVSGEHESSESAVLTVTGSSNLEESKSKYVIDMKCGKAEFNDNWDEEKICRICHLSSDRLDVCKTDFVLLGCGCKNELGTAHIHCAEVWFKLKGNRLCEICGETAINVTGIGDNRFMEEWNENRLAGTNANSSERSRGCWRGQTFCNFLMACLVIAFVLPWFFRVNMF